MKPSPEVFAGICKELGSLIEAKYMFIAYLDRENNVRCVGSYAEDCTVIEGRKFLLSFVKEIPSRMAKGEL